MRLANWFNSIADEVEKDPSRWTQGCFVRDTQGRVLPLMDVRKGACWCISGFMERDGIDSVRAAYCLNLSVSGSLATHITYNDRLKNSQEFVVWLRRAAAVAQKGK
jgi:hypothetical protein